MAKSQIIEVEGVGPILFERSKRAKHLIIHVKPFTGVRVAVPYGVSWDKAEKIVTSKIDWIHKQQANGMGLTTTRCLSGTRERAGGVVQPVITSI